MTPFEQVAAYAAGTLTDDAAATLEQQLFVDPALQDAAAFVLDLVDGLRELVRRGPVLPVLTPAQLPPLAALRRVIECYPQGTVLAVAIPDDVEFVCARLPVGLRDAVRIDVGIGKPGEPPYFIVREAPFDPESGEVCVLCNRHVAIAASHIRVVITDERNRVRGEFTLVAS